MICRIERGERVPSEGEVRALLTALDIAEEKTSSLPVRQLNVASRVIGMTQGLKVQITLEQMLDTQTTPPAGVPRSPGRRSPQPLTFYVPLDGLDMQEVEDEKEETIRSKYPGN